MTCPDIERLIEVADVGITLPDVEAHLQECADCRASLRFVRLAQTAYREEMPVSEPSVQRALSTVMAATQTESWTPSGTPWDLVSTGLLTSLTAALVLAVTGAIGSGGPLAVLSLLALGGCGAAWEYRIGSLEQAG